MTDQGQSPWYKRDRELVKRYSLVLYLLLMTSPMNKLHLLWPISDGEHLRPSHIITGANSGAVTAGGLKR